MKSRGVRVLLCLVAVAALAAAGAGVWRIEQRIAEVRAAADAFERDAREAVVGLGDWRAAQQACVAEGQPSEAWMTKAAALAQKVGARLAALRTSARSVEGQGAIEAAIEAFTSAAQNDTKAREYLKSGQRLSASDAIFVSAAPALERAVVGVDTARGQEQVAFAVALEDLRRWEVVALGSAAAVLLIAVLLLVPIPRPGSSEGAGGEDLAADGESILPLPRGLIRLQDLDDGVVSGPQVLQERLAAVAREPEQAPAEAKPKADKVVSLDSSSDERAAAWRPNLDAVADLCVSLARAQDTSELPALLERTARTLDAAGIIVWMPEGPQGVLRPVLSHGYPPLTLSRMGVIHPGADNATATAYRIRSTVVVPAEPLSSGAVVAPLVSWEGCSGAMALELREGVEVTPQVRAVATIVAAQLATMLAPGTASSPAANGSSSAGGLGWPGSAAGGL